MVKKRRIFEFGWSVLASLLACVFIVSCAPTSGGSSEEDLSESNSSSNEIVQEYTDAVSYTHPSEVDFSGYTTFYFDGTSGNDKNSGKNELAPKKSLAEVARLASTATEDYPVRILLKRGTEFSGRLILTGYTATAEKPLVISDYGSASAMPKLTGIRNDTDTVYEVVKVTESNTRIFNLEVTDPYAYQGINVYAIRVGKMENIVIENCYVHDVNFFWKEGVHDPDNPPTTNKELDEICPEFNSSGSYGRYYTRTNGGIIFQNDTSAQLGASWFENVWAIGNKIERVARTGLYMATKWSNAPGIGYGNNKYVERSERYNNSEKGIGFFIHKNVNFCDNFLNVIGGDGIILTGDDSFLDGNVCYRANYLGRAGEANAQGASTTYYNAAIWVYNSVNVYFQNNEAAYTFLRNGAGDGEGFDIDNACKNIYFQYNYAHHNEGGGLLVCNATTSLLRYDESGTCISPNKEAESLLGDWGNNYCRNNVFAYNGKQNDSSRSAFITIARPTNDFYCYNNTVVLGANTRQNIINQEDGAAFKHYYANNLIYSTSTVEGLYELDAGKTVFEHNLYYNVGTPYLDYRDGSYLETSYIHTVDPRIEITGALDGIQSVLVYKANNADVYTLGKLVNGALSTDILKNVARDVKYIGAFAEI